MWKIPRLGKHFSATLRPAISPALEPQPFTHLPRVQTSVSRWHAGGTRRFGFSWPRLRDLSVGDESEPSTPKPPPPRESGNVSAFATSLPVVCSGCGALSQTVERDSPGFFSEKKRNIKASKKQHEDDVFHQAMQRLSNLDVTAAVVPSLEQLEETSGGNEPLICDRCHDLLYQSKGTSIVHPSMQSIQDIIESSPHRHNHIYHVLDAADFPLSLIPNLISALDLPRLRTQNRRSKSRQYVRGRTADVSFIITRSDLLAPMKEQVDRLMPYLQDVLRDALGRTGKNVRLGNVRCVSAKRGWWTPNVKQEIWERGGAGWVVGKVNVGKSALFEVVFPKGRNHVEQDAEIKAMRLAGATPQEIDNHVLAQAVVNDAENVALPGSRSGASDPPLGEMNMTSEEAKDHSFEATLRIDALSEEHELDKDTKEEHETSKYDDEDETELNLLPPARPETQYPSMPTVSALPGTTASPIRIPYGNGKGELIDLPGVQRSSLETHVQPQHWSSLVMTSRVVPEQYTIKPGQSLLIGGIIRITPKTDELIFLAYPFTPLKAHATGNQKATAIQTGILEDGSPYSGNIENIGTDKAKQRIKSAGTFKLAWDVTKQRAGPVTDKTAGKQKAEDLPYIVYGADLLIEGVGWVELVCQVRSRRKSLIADALGAEFDQNRPLADDRPEIEVFTPKGKFIGVRKPMNAWLLGGPKKVAKHARRSRPRMTISMHKRKEGGKRGSQEAHDAPT